MIDTAKFMNDYVIKILDKRSHFPYKYDIMEDDFFRYIKEYEQSKRKNYHTFIPYDYNNDEFESDSESYYSIDVLSDDD